MLVNARPSTDKGIRSNIHAPREHDIVGQDYMVTNHAIMPDVAVCHKKAAIPDFREPSLPGGTVDRYSLAKSNPVSHANPRRGTRIESGILRKATKDGMGVKKTSIADYCPGAYAGPFPDDRPPANLDPVLDNGVGSDCNVLVDTCGLVYDGRGMKIHVVPYSLNSPSWESTSKS